MGRKLSGGESGQAVWCSECSSRRRHCGLEQSEDGQVTVKILCMDCGHVWDVELFGDEAMFDA